MRRQLKTLAVSTLLTVFAVYSAVAQEAEFDEASLILEVNETDGDAEIVVNVESEEALSRLRIFDARGKEILDLRSKDRGKIGLSEIAVESAEPSIDGVLAAYPEGVYKLRARTVDGAKIDAEATLSHELLPAPSFGPANGEVVDPDNVLITWLGVPGAAAYIVEIEQDDLDVNLTTKLSAGATSFSIPIGFLQPGIEYEVGVATVSPNGNIAVAEGSFTTVAP